MIHVSSRDVAHTFDTKANLARGRDIAGRDLTYTCGAGATLLVLSIVTDGLTARSGGAPTYNGVPMQQAATNSQYPASGETDAELWYMLAPPTTSALTIHIPDANNVFFTAEASSYAAQAGKTSALRVADVGNGHTTTMNTPSLAGGTSDDVLVAVVGNSANTWAPTDTAFTSLYDVDDGSYGDSAQYALGPTDPVPTGYYWTFSVAQYWATVAAIFKEVDAAPPSTGSGFFAFF